MKPKISSLVFEVTSACNLNCRYCYNIWKAPGGSPPPSSSYKQAIRTLRRAFKIANVQNVSFSGGEPFLAERLAELVLFCRMAGKSVNLISNGALAAPEDWKTMIDLGVHLFELPLHSANPDAHEQMTGTPGSWEASLVSIRQLLKLGGKVVVAFILSRMNQNLVRETLLFLKEEGVQTVMFNRFNIGGRGIDFISDLLPNPECLQEAFSQANEVARSFGMKISSNVCTPRCLLDSSKFPSIRFSTCTPNISKRPLTLDVAGNLRFCNHSPVVMGNIFEDSIEGIFKTQYVENWRDKVPSICVDCAFWERCFGGCRAAAEQLGQGLDHPDPIIRFSKTID